MAEKGRKNNLIDREINAYLRQSPVAALDSGSKCPCGSQKIFGECCQGQGAVFRVAWETDQGHPVLIDEKRFRDYARDLLQAAYKQAQRGTLARGKVSDFLADFYGKYDRLNDLFSPYTACQIGCNSCCHYNVGVSYIEAEYIRQFVVQNIELSVLKTIISRIKDQQKHYIRETQRPRHQKQDEAMLADYFKKNLPCPFLAENNKCLIYSVRPFTCRAHSAVSSPDSCRTGKSLELLDVMNLNQYLGTLLAELSYNSFGISRWEHIGIWFVDGFGGGSPGEASKK
ncbi:MAG: YkgJ family cysteine cluster protein [Candidatus Saccharibacteria bacterium]